VLLCFHTNKGVGTVGPGGHDPFVFIQVTLAPKVNMKIAETAQRIMWIKRNVITDHTKNVAAK